MKLQDFFPYDADGLSGIYHPTEEGYFINSSCVQSDGDIKPSQLFLLQTFDADSESDIELVKLLDVFYFQGTVNFYVLDMVSKETKIISHCISNGYIDIRWKITEINFLLELIENGYEFTIPRTNVDINREIV